MPKLWLPPNVWFHGSQSTSTGGVSARNDRRWRMTCWLLASMRCVLTTALGARVEPEVSRNLAIESSVTAACAPSTASVGSVPSSASMPVVARPAGSPPVVISSVPAGTAAAMARAKRAPSAANTAPGVSSATIPASLAKSVATSE